MCATPAPVCHQSDPLEGRREGRRQEVAHAALSLSSVWTHAPHYTSRPTALPARLSPIPTRVTTTEQRSLCPRPSSRTRMRLVRRNPALPTQARRSRASSSLPHCDRCPALHTLLQPLPLLCPRTFCRNLPQQSPPTRNKGPTREEAFRASALSSQSQCRGPRAQRCARAWPHEIKYGGRGGAVPSGPAPALADVRKGRAADHGGV